MIDIKVYREYWEGVQKRIPEIKKVLPVTIDEEMSKTIQGLSKEECPVLFILIPSGTGASLSADNVRENNLCVIFLMSKYDPQRKGAYETIEEVQPVMERIKQMLIEDSATGCPVTKELDLTSLSYWRYKYTSNKKNETVKDEPGERHIITGFSKNE